MNPGQQKFNDFVMSLVVPGNEGAAQDVLANSFGRQDHGSLSPDQIDAAVARLTPLLKPEAVGDLRQAAGRLKELGEQQRMDERYEHEHADHHHGERPWDGSDEGWTLDPPAGGLVA